MSSNHAYPRPVRVCVTGAECTGKTSLAAALGRRLGAPVIHEPVRHYFEEKCRVGDPNVYAGDIVRAVDLQIAAEDAAPMSSPLLVLDTDVFTIWVWHRRYVGKTFGEIEDLLMRRQASDKRIDLYVLASPDIPFEHDGVRGSEEGRSQMHEVFARELVESGRRFVQVHGNVQQRCNQALDEVRLFLSEESVRLRAQPTAV